MRHARPWTIAVIATVLSSFVLYGTVLAHEQSKTDGKMITIRGEVLDSACFISHGAKGEKHKKCAVQCAKKGIPLAILAKDGTLYLLNEDHNNAEAYAAVRERAGEVVKVTGRLIEKHGWKVVFVQKVEQP